MKNIVLFPVLLLFPFFINSQSLEDLEVVGPEQGGFIPVMKNGQWGIVNLDGDLVVDFRSDLIYNETPNSKTDLGVGSFKYPKLSENRAIVKKVNNQIPYYGFIDATGSVVIEPQFLNVSNFKDGLAFALKIEEKALGRNDLLDKNIKSYKYDVVLIDPTGKVIDYLAGPFPVAISKEKLRAAPLIEARWIGNNLVAVKTPSKKWAIHKIGIGEKIRD